MQQIDQAVDGREGYIEGPRVSLLADAFVDSAAQHVMLLHRRETIDPVVVGVGLEIFGDQAGRVALINVVLGKALG